jgi:hypothetical protein
MSIIMKNSNGYRRAHFITQADAEKEVAAGRATKHAGYDIYEEIENAKIDKHEYDTKVLEPVKRGRAKKSDEAE